MSQTTLQRLHSDVSAVAPIDGVAMIDEAAQQARIDYAVSATETDKASGDAVLAAFDWSETENEKFLAQVATDSALAAIDRGTTIKGLSIDRAIIALALVVLDTFNTDRAAFAAMNSAVQAATSLADLKTRFAAINFPSQATQGQLLNAVKAKLQTLPT